jgi:radical SAM superfamily enzyme YgiQ (UPF0313 family)
MKILLIMPDGKINKISLFSHSLSFREAPLTLTHLAALTPESIDADYTLIDGSLGTSIPYDINFDLVGISLMTGTSTEGYGIADRFRKLGVPVVLGGIHVTLLPEEAQQHADCIVRGFAETSWPGLLHDLKKGSLKSEYYEEVEDLSVLPFPRRDLQKTLSYMIPNTVMITRGCRGSCDFCSVPAANYGFKKRPVKDVIEEIRRISTKKIAISDVHLTDDVNYAKELFTAMIPLKKEWGALASTRVASDPELLELMQKSGCKYLLLGFESVNSFSLERINKGFNRVGEYRVVIDTLHRYGITIQGCFIFGFDEDGPEVFQDTIDTINDLGIDIPRYALFTPYPGTEAYKRMERNGQLLHKDWSYYDTQHVVIRPKNLTPLQLDKGLLYAYKNTFKVIPSLQRSMNSGGSAAVTFIGNLAYKHYIYRLSRDKDRFPLYIPPDLLNRIASG